MTINHKNKNQFQFTNYLKDGIISIYYWKLRGDILTDLEKAKLLLFEENLTLAVVKDGELIFKSQDKGIKPMFTLATSLKEKAKGAALADRVIGKGAAILAGYVGINEIYTDLISQGGIERLEYYKISYRMENSCEYIKNRDKTGLCPIENISKDIEDPLTLIESIEEFLEKISKGVI